MRKDVIGLSIGSKNTVIGTYKKGIFEVVLSETSSSSIPTVVPYNDQERNITELSMPTNQTIIYPNRWLGIQKDWPFRSEEGKHAFVKPVEDKTGKICFYIDYKGKKEIYTPESLMGLFFSKLKKEWDRENIKTNDVVVSVPDYYTAYERKAMLEAVGIGGLYCTTLLNESSAITFAYGFQKLKEFDDEKKRVVAFVDFGHSSTTIFFSEFNKKLVNVVSVTAERFCGARDFDYLIAQKLAEDFEKKYGCNPMEDPKTKIRLVDTINKVRKSLTVNKEITITVESLMDGKDLIYNLSRDEFEEIIKPVTQKFENLCKKALEKATKEANIKLENLYGIEMVGGTVRTPVIQNVVKTVFGKEVNKTFGFDECIARGCALYAMMNSPYYTNQNYNFIQYNPYSIEMEYPFLKDGKEVVRKMVLIKKGEDVPAYKNINYTNKQLPDKELIPVKFYYKNDPELDWLPNRLLNSYSIYLKKKKEKNWKLSIKYVLDVNCIPKLEEVILSENKTEMDPVFTKQQVKEEFFLFALKKDEFKKENNQPQKNEEKISLQNEHENNKGNKEVENLKNENKLLKKENEILRKENENLKEKLDRLNLIRDQEIKNIEKQYKNIIEEKDNKIEYLLLKLTNNNVENKNYNNLLDKEKLIAVNFISVDQRINHTIICRNKTKFHIIEEQLYEKYPEYLEDENFFMFKGNKINRFKSLEDNGIQPYTIMLKKIED